MILEDNRSGLIKMVDLAEPLGMAVVSVECRLAPETPHPGPVEDCYAGMVWLSAHAARAEDLSGLPPTFGVEPPSGFEPETYAVPGGSLMVFHPG